MSRTFRRKNKETPELYTKYLVLFIDGKSCWMGSVLKTGDELKETIRKFHQDGKGTFGHSAPKWHRKETSVLQRMHDKSELFKYLKRDYEPMVYSKMRMGYWT